MDIFPCAFSFLNWLVGGGGCKKSTLKCVTQALYLVKFVIERWLLVLKIH